jgi:hypothetical protein
VVVTVSPMTHNSYELHKNHIALTKLPYNRESIYGVY